MINIETSLIETMTNIKPLLTTLMPVTTLPCAPPFTSPFLSQTTGWQNIKEFLFVSMNALLSKRGVFSFCSVKVRVTKTRDALAEFGGLRLTRNRLQITCYPG